MKAKVWFEAYGQRLRARGYSWVELKQFVDFYRLPRFAQSALARGHLHGG